MKISEVIKELEGVEEVYGDIECQLQNDPKESRKVVSHEGFFIVPEEYESETICNIRVWSH